MNKTKVFFFFVLLFLLYTGDLDRDISTVTLANFPMVPIMVGLLNQIRGKYPTKEPTLDERVDHQAEDGVRCL